MSYFLVTISKDSPGLHLNESIQMAFFRTQSPLLYGGMPIRKRLYKEFGIEAPPELFYTNEYVSVSQEERPEEELAWVQSMKSEAAAARDFESAAFLRDWEKALLNLLEA